MATPQKFLRKVVRAVGDQLDIHLVLQRSAVITAAAYATGELLDVGCGNKPWLDVFRPRVSKYTGIEHESVFSETTASTSGSGENAPDLYYRGDALPFADASFDTVASFQVLEHTADPFVLVRDMARVLRPGGRLILSAPFSYRVHEAPHDFFRYTAHGLQSLVEREHLRVESVIPFGGLWSVLAHKVNSHLVLKVARLGSLGQSVGKLSQEGPIRETPRWFTVPAVVPMVGALSAAGRIADKLAPDPVEALGYVIVARKDAATTSASR